MKNRFIRPVKFPSKTDCHPPKGYVNWWEAEFDGVGKGTLKQELQKEIDEGVEEYEEDKIEN
jgi:hypothetical protein